MGHLVLTAKHVLLYEVFFEIVAREVRNGVLTKVNKGFTLSPVGGLTHFFLDDLEQLISAGCMMLILQDPSKAFTSCILDVFIALIDEVYKHRYQIRMYLGHVKQMDRLN